MPAPSSGSPTPELSGAPRYPPAHVSPSVDCSASPRWREVETALATLADEVGELLRVTPRRLRLLEGPGAGPGGWALCLDADLGETGGAGENGRARSRIWIRPPEAKGPVLLRHPALTLTHEGRAGEGWARRLQDELRRKGGDERLGRLAERIARARLRWADPDPEDLGPLEEAQGLLEPEEARLLRPLGRAYREHYGVGPRLVRLGPGPASVAFPDVVPDQSLFMAVAKELSADLRLRAYLADLGYRAEGDRVRVVPTPAALARRQRALGIEREGFGARLARAWTPVLGPRFWLANLAEGRFPINLRSDRAHRWTAPARNLSRRLHKELATMWHTHFHAFPHDMSLHVLGMHRLTPGRTAELRRLAGAGARARPFGARRFADFFEGHLTRSCVSAWSGLEHPDDLPARLDAAAGAALEVGPR